MGAAAHAGEEDAAAGKEARQTALAGLEFDIVAILSDWAAASREGIDEFIHQSLAAHLDKPGEESWTNLLTNLAGSTTPAVAAFLPSGPCALAVLRASVAAPLLLFSHSAGTKNLRLVQDLLYRQIESARVAVMQQVRAWVAAAMHGSPGVTRHRALADFLQSNFNASEIVIPADPAAKPHLNPVAIRTKVLQQAIRESRS